LKTIQVTIDEPLLVEVDRAIRELGVTRSAFIRDALRRAVRRHRIAQMERKHAEGYARHPVRPGEFDGWEDEQVWPEAQKPGS
jgi:metal-responsive CopG/Arc/MetJ family transcriptional regulator